MEIKSGQVAVISGAASGIGYALAEALAQRGVRLVLADVQAEALQQAIARLVAAGAQAIGEKVNVSQLSDVERLRDRTLAEFGQVDMVFNNAGIVVPRSAMWETSVENWNKLIKINLLGVVNGIHVFVPLLVKQGSGYVVNTASMAGVSVIPYNGAYNASKHAVVSITETMRAELDDRQTGVGATVVCPGLVRTNMTTSPDAAAPHPAVANSTMLEPSEVAKQVLLAIEQNQLYLATNPGPEGYIADRIARLAAETAHPLA